MDVDIVRTKELGESYIKDIGDFILILGPVFTKNLRR